MRPDLDPVPCPVQALAPGAETTLDAAALEAIAGEAPSATLRRDAVVGAALADVAVAAGLQPSKGATRRLIKVLAGSQTQRSTSAASTPRCWYRGQGLG